MLGFVQLLRRNGASIYSRRYCFISFYIVDVISVTSEDSFSTIETVCFLGHRVLGCDIYYYDYQLITIK